MGPILLEGQMARGYGTAIRTVQLSSFKSGQDRKVVSSYAPMRSQVDKCKIRHLKLFSLLCTVYFSYNIQNFHSVVGQDPVTTHGKISASGPIVM